MKPIQILKPKCTLRKKAFDLNNEDWQPFRRKCIELMAILKAFQFKQSRGLDWFAPDEELLNIYLPTWRHYLLKLVNARIININPHNQKLDFEDNTSSLSILELKSTHKVNKLKDILLYVNSEKYGDIYKKMRKRKKKKKIKLHKRSLLRLTPNIRQLNKQFLANQ